MGSEQKPSTCEEAPQCAKPDVGKHLSTCEEAPQCAKLEVGKHLSTCEEEPLQRAKPDVWKQLSTSEAGLQCARPDVGNHFVTDVIFPSKEDLVSWARNVGRELGFVVIIQRADKLTGRAKPRVILGCDRSGFPRSSQNKRWVKKNLRKTSSKRCGCPFSLQGQRDEMNEWRLDVRCGFHNHDFVNLEAHSYAGRLDEDEQKIVHEMYASGVKPRKILAALKKRNASNTTSLRTIYNEKFKMYRKELGGKTPIQFLNKCINDAGYINFNHMDNATNQMESLFFTHPTSLQFCNIFPDVFIMNCAYKTNRYRLPLLYIIGLTSTNQTFFSAFSFLSKDTEASYIWALECFKSMLDQSSLPSVLVIDKEIALMNAIRIVFPQSKILLCQVHINKNIMTHCKKYFKQGKDFQNFLCIWQHLVNSPTIDDFDARFNMMLSSYAEQYPDVLRYVVTTWIEPYKEYFISAWIDKFLHLGSSTANHVESLHGQLKNFLEVSIGNLTTIWKTFDEMISHQHVEIKKSFEESTIQADTRFRGSLYAELLGSVSFAALDIIKKEEDSIMSGYHETGNCTHKMRHTMGLPCAHELVPYLHQFNAFPLSMIHKHWKQLSLHSAWK
ncbi:hypothetical protein KSP39_PZI019685 [Platanthera zijinensis]|uniref:Protein FAR1-RELATED SEQUENCE n=1 Tax=Platanthera zijinensis TaxID=2320716 RepID=A0AAP0B1G4_9ASPA